MRLIDADTIKIPSTHVDIFENCRNCRLLDESEVKQIIDDAPTVDAVPVVRCKDCIHWCATVTHSTLCDHYDTPDAFCSHGKRRIDEAN